MNIHLVLFAKNEEDYIEDFMIYYYNLGIDYIAIYDNNDDSNKLPKFISNSTKLQKYKDNYLIKHIKTYRGNQIRAYKDYIFNYNKNFNHLLIVDTDEFLDLNNYCNNIRELIEKNKNYQYISFRRINYDDNDIIERDMSTSVLENSLERLII